MAQATRKYRTPPEQRDPPVAKGAELTVLTALKAYQHEAEAARRTRLAKNKYNWDAYMGEVILAGLREGSQSRLPKLAMAAEQTRAFIKRGLTDFGDWFSIDLLDERSGLTTDQARKLLQAKLMCGGGHSGRLDFVSTLSGAVLVALLRALAVFKVHGQDVQRYRFVVERGYQPVQGPDGPFLQLQHNLIRKQVSTWELIIDLVLPEDYLPDPTGRGLYEMHQVERDIAEVQEMADAGVYDREVVKAIDEDFARQEEIWHRSRDRRDEERPPFRKRVQILECYGSLLREDGRYAEKNILCASANHNAYLLRPPEPNPFWHGESPFVSAPLIHVPDTAWHKALYDDAIELNASLEKLFNQILDGGMASVWGLRQVRPEYLEDPRTISGGIPPNFTAVVREGAPPDVKVIEQVATGQVPAEALATYNLVDQEFQQATQVNSIKLGQTPNRSTTATAIVEAQNQSNTFFDGMIRDIEDKLIEPALWKAWCCVMQFMDDAHAKEVVDAVGEEAALRLAEMSPAERYAAFAGCRFHVSGLSAILARMRDFQKKMLLSNAITQSPLLLQAFWQEYSPKKWIASLFKDLGLDPEHLKMDQDEQAAAPEQQQQVLQLMQAMGGGQTKPEGVPGAGPGEETPPPLERMPASAVGQ